MIKLEERKARIQPIKPKQKVNVLDQEDIEKINRTARDILEEVGVIFPSEKALRIFADAGVNVDFDKKLVKIPSHFVTECLEKVPKRFTMAGRRPELDVKIGDEKGTYFFCSGGAPNVVDFESGEKRRATKADLEKMVRVVDYFPIVSLVWPSVSAGDKGETAPIHEVEACFNNTEKHIQGLEVMDAISARYTIDMASVIAGGKDKLKQRPIYSLLLCSIAPLTQHRGGLESALTFAEAGLPVGLMSMPTMGLTAPPYQAADLAVGLAEDLSGCVLIQLAYPGTPIFITIQPAIIDPRSGDYFYGSAFSQITSAAAVEVAHSNGLAISSQFTFGGNAYRLNSWQVGMENVLGHLLSIMAGADMSFGPSSIIDAMTLLDMTRIMFDREIFQALDVISKGIEVNDETLAFDLIRDKGPGGSFLVERATALEMRKIWPESILFEFSETEGERFRNAEEVAREVIDWVLKHHQPAPLDEQVKQELERIVAAADRDEDLRREISGRK